MYPAARASNGNQSSGRPLGTSMPVAGRGLALGDSAVARYTIPDGDGGVYATVDHMAKLVAQGSTDPLVRRMAVSIASRVAPRDYDAQALAIRAWLSAHVAFMRDPDGTELLHTAAVMVTSVIANRDGVIHVDCDDVAILAGALGKAIGLICRVVTVAFKDLSQDPRVPATGREPFAHTWAELSSPIGSPRWIEMDTTRAAQGVDPSYIARSFNVEV